MLAAVQPLDQFLAAINEMSGSLAHFVFWNRSDFAS